MFKYIKDFNRLNLQSKLESLKDAMCSLLSLLIRICIFVREYLRPNVIGKRLFNLHLSIC